MSALTANKRLWRIAEPPRSLGQLDRLCRKGLRPHRIAVPGGRLRIAGEALGRHREPEAGQPAHRCSPQRT